MKNIYLKGLSSLPWASLLNAPVPLLQQIIAFINDKTQPDYYGYLLLVGMFVGNYIGTISEAQYFQIISRAGMHIRCALVHTIFRKATQISNQALKEVSHRAL